MNNDEICESILLSVKKLLGMNAEYTHFDPDIIMHINSVLSILTQMGVGPPDGFSISGEDEKWVEFISEKRNHFSLLKSYVYMKVRLLFDPPIASSALEAMKAQIAEYEWRLHVEADPIPESKQEG